MQQKYILKLYWNIEGMMIIHSFCCISFLLWSMIALFATYLWESTSGAPCSNLIMLKSNKKLEKPRLFVLHLEKHKKFEPFFDTFGTVAAPLRQDWDSKVTIAPNQPCKDEVTKTIVFKFLLLTYLLNVIHVSCRHKIFGSQTKRCFNFLFSSFSFRRNWKNIPLSGNVYSTKMKCKLC